MEPLGAAINFILTVSFMMLFIAVPASLLLGIYKIIFFKEECNCAEKG